MHTIDRMALACLMSVSRFTNTIMYTYICNFLQIYTEDCALIKCRQTATATSRIRRATLAASLRSGARFCRRHHIRGVAPRGHRAPGTKAPPPPARAPLHRHVRAAVGPGRVEPPSLRGVSVMASARRQCSVSAAPWLTVTSVLPTATVIRVMTER